MKPYYQDKLTTIYCGDGQKVAQTLDKIDVIVTDPPYGISHPCDFLTRGRSNLAACSDYSDVVGDDVPFDPSWILGMSVPALLWGANHYADKLPPSSGWLVWDKLRPHTLDQATAELAWTNFVKGVRVFRYLWNGMIRHGNETLYHPTQKPVALMVWCLSLKWTPKGTVFDPYMGAGATALAAKQTGHRFIGVEISEEYCEVAVKRLSQETEPLPLWNSNKEDRSRDIERLDTGKLYGNL